MRRVLLFCAGILLGLAALAVLWNSHEWYCFEDGWHSAVFTRMVGWGVIVEGALIALAAALCIGRAVSPLSAGPLPSDPAAPGGARAEVAGGPVLPICGILFLLAAAGPAYYHDTAEGAFRVSWLCVAIGLLTTPLYLEAHAWRLGWRINRVGRRLAIGGLSLSGLSAFICYANGMAMEGASEGVHYIGELGLLAGVFVAAVGGIVVVRGWSKP